MPHQNAQPRRTRARARLSLLAGVLLVSASGCVTVRSSELKRGDHIGTFPVSHEVTDKPAVVVDAANVARVEVARTTCTVSSIEHQQVEHQVISHPRYGQMVANQVIGLVGVGAAWGGQQFELSPLDTMLTVGGLAVVALSVGSTIYGLATNQEYEPRVLPSPIRHKERKNDCLDSSFALAQSVPWELSTDKGRRAGVTGADGRLALTPAMLAIVDNGTTPSPARELAMGAVLGFDLKLGKAPSSKEELDATSIPAAVWERWSTDYAKTLPPEKVLRLDGCRTVTNSARAGIECLWLPKQYSRSVTELEGVLARTEMDDYGMLVAFKGRKGQAFSYRMLLPGGNADWLVQVTDLETGVVVAQKFSSVSARHDIEVVLPRTSEYALVLNAETPGRFRANLTFGRAVPP